MGREFIGECPGSGEDPESDDYETELAIKYIKQKCGQPPCGVDVQVTWEDHELGTNSSDAPLRSSAPRSFTIYVVADVPLGSLCGTRELRP